MMFEFLVSEFLFSRFVKAIKFLFSEFLFSEFVKNSEFVTTLPCRAACEAFAMGLLQRLGAQSLVVVLSEGVVRMILDQL